MDYDFHVIRTLAIAVTIMVITVVGGCTIQHGSYQESVRTCITNGNLVVSSQCVAK